MKELIKESIIDFKKNEEIIYLTSKGERIELQEAVVRGIAVTPVNPKVEAVKKLEAAGLFLTDTKFVNQLNELIAVMNGYSTIKPAGNKTTFSKAEKRKIIEEWKKVEQTGKKTKAAFVREIGVSYQTFLNWLKALST